MPSFLSQLTESILTFSDISPKAASKGQEVTELAVASAIIRQDVSYFNRPQQLLSQSPGRLLAC